jgi:general secretion pathway protein D
MEKLSLRLTVWSKHLNFSLVTKLGWRLVKRWSFLIVPLIVSACVTQEERSDFEFSSLREPKQAVVDPLYDVAGSSFESTTVNVGPLSSYKPGVADFSGLQTNQPLPDAQFKGSYNNMAVSTFINEVFGDQLGLSFAIEPEVQALSDLVSLRLVNEVSAAELLAVGLETLASYGVTMTIQSSLYSFSMSDNATASGTPLVVTGQALPEVPASHRPLFLWVQIDVVSSNALSGWLGNAMRGQELQISTVPQSNALLLQGKPDIIEEALSIVELLDQPAMRGKFSSIVEPAYGDSELIAKDLMEILRSEGYDASMRPPGGGVLLLPLVSANRLVVIASAQEVLDHVVDWVKLLDQKSTTSIESGLFIYQARNTDAEYLVDLLVELEAIDSEGGLDDQEAVRGPGTRFIADVNRNAIIFKGSGQDWIELLPSIKEMDQPTPSVLVEVILAEVTLNDQDELGLEFLARSGDVTFSTMGGIGLGGSGMTATLNRAGETRAVINAFYKSDRANIKSRPRLMVKSGQQASIDVGNEIPVVTSTSQSTDVPGSPVIQTVTYRNTGVLLQIEPVVHSSGYVDIRISQELSEAQQTSTSSINSPTIFNRKLETTVTLRDGGSVLLGGLISETSSTSKNGVKGLGRLPGIGRLFRKDAKVTDKTELIMMVIPYIIENPDEAMKISDRALESLELTR